MLILIFRGCFGKSRPSAIQFLKQIVPEHFFKSHNIVSLPSMYNHERDDDKLYTPCFYYTLNIQHCLYLVSSPNMAAECKFITAKLQLIAA